MSSLRTTACDALIVPSDATVVVYALICVECLSLSPMPVSSVCQWEIIKGYCPS